MIHIYLYLNYYSSLIARINIKKIKSEIFREKKMTINHLRWARRTTSDRSETRNKTHFKQIKIYTNM